MLPMLKCQYHYLYIATSKKGIRISTAMTSFNIGKGRMNTVTDVLAMKLRDLLYVTVIWGQMIIRVLTITRGGSVELIIDISIRRFVSLTRLFCCLWSRPPRSGFYVLCA